LQRWNDDENVVDRLADEAVLATVKVPDICVNASGQGYDGECTRR